MLIIIDDVVYVINVGNEKEKIYDVVNKVKYKSDFSVFKNFVGVVVRFSVLCLFFCGKEWII